MQAQFHCYEEFENSIEFFDRIRRQRMCSSWFQEQLVLRSEFRPLRNDVLMDTADELLMDSMSDSEQPEGYYEENLLILLEEET